MQTDYQDSRQHKNENRPRRKAGDPFDLSKTLPCRSLSVAESGICRNHSRHIIVSIHERNGNMSGTKANMKPEEALDELIRKEIGSANNRRFLTRLPAFKVDADIPDQFHKLLAKLDRAESGRSRPRN